MQNILRKLLTLWTLLFILLSNFQVGVLYADSQSSLKLEKDKSVAHLEKVEKVINLAVWKIDKKLKKGEVKERLEEKQEEIKEYLEKAQKEINWENSKSDIKNITSEAKKVVVLKLVSWVTKQVDLEENISNDVASTKKEKKEALETIQESMEDWKNYSLIISTKYDNKKVYNLFKKFDDKIKLDFLYKDWKNNVFEIFISKNSIFAEEILEDIKYWNIPESFLWIEIITPEVFSIWTTVNPLPVSPKGREVAQINLTWENLNSTWWVEKFNPNNYLSKLKTQMSTEGFSPLNWWKTLKIWVIDTWIDYNHPDLKWRVSKWKDFVNKDDDAFDDQGHWTHVAWTIWASINWKWIIWVNPYVEFVPLKICNSRGFCPSYWVIKALDYAKTEKIDILNMSLWGRWNPNSHAICTWISNVVNSGLIVIAASWNSNIDTSSFVPWGCSDAITVAAIDQDLNRAWFSNYGQKVDISAPWVQIYSTLPNNKYKKLSWTSMATPHIVWLVSVMKSFDKNLDTKKVKNLFKENSIKTTYESGKYIADFPDVEKILKEITKTEQAQVIAPTDNLDESIEEKTESWSLDESEKKDEAEINPDLNFIEKKDDVFNLPELEDLKINNTLIDFWKTGSWVKINNIENEAIKSEKIEEILEEKKEHFDAPKIQHFNESWKILEEEVKINNTEKSEKVEWEYFEWDLIPEIKTFTWFIDDEETNWVKINNIEDEVKDFFIDWAKSGVEINSLEEEKPEEIILEEYSTWSIEEEILDENWKKILDEDWNEIDFSKLEKVEIVEEKIDNLDLKHTSEILIDWAEKWVKINSVWDSDEKLPEPMELEEYTENKIISSFPWTLYLWEELEQTEIKTENISEIQKEILIDWAERWVEINSVWEDELEEIEVEVFKAWVVNLPEELTQEEIKKLKEELEEEESWVNINSFDEAENSNDFKIILTKEDEEKLEKEFSNRAENEKIELETNEFEYKELNLNSEIDLWKIEWLEWNSWIEINSYDIEEKEVENKIETEEDLKNIIINEDEIEEIELPEIDLKENYNIDDSKFENLWEDEIINIESEDIEPSTNSWWVENNGIDIANTYYCNTYVWEYCKLYFPKPRYYKKYYSNRNVAYVIHRRNNVSIYGRNIWRSTIKWYDFNRKLAVTVYVNIKTKPQLKPFYKSVNISVNKYTRVNLDWAHRFSYSYSRYWIANIHTWYNYLNFYWRKAWNFSLYIRERWRYIWTININVQPPTLYKTTQVWKNIHQSLRRSRYYKYYLSDNSLATVSASKRWYYIKPKKAWNLNIQVRDRYWNIQYYLNVKITPPPVFEDESYVWYNFVRNFRWAYWYNYNFSDNSLAWTVNRNYYNYTLLPKKAWILNIEVKDRYWATNHILKLTIKNPPEVKHYDIKVEEWKYVDIRFPENWNYKIYYTHREKWWYAYVYWNNQNIKVKWHIFWKITYKVFNKWLELYRLNIEVVPKIQIYNEEIFETQKKYISLSSKIYAYWYEISTNNEWIIWDIIKHSRWLYYTWKKEWEVEIYIKSKWYHVATYKIKVKPVPKPIEYDVTVEEWKYTNIYLPDNFYYYYSLERKWNAYAYFYNYYYQKRVMLRWHIWWDLKYYIKDRLWITRYILNVKVIPKPPIIIHKTVYETKWLSIRTWRSNKYSISYSWKWAYFWYIRKWSRDYSWPVYGSWSMEVYVRNWEWKHIYTYKITVLPKPKPIVYNVEMEVDKDMRFYLPDNLYNYNIYAENNWHFSSAYRYYNYFYLRAWRLWKSKITLSERYWNRWVKYIINVNVKVPESTTEIYYWELYKQRWSSLTNIKNLTPSILDIVSKWDHYIKWKKYWTWKIWYYRYWKLKSITNYVVKAKPQPKQLTCTTTVDSQCSFSLKNYWYSYSTTRSWMINIEAEKYVTKVKTHWSWTAKIYIKSEWWSYYAYILTIIVKPQPVKQYICEWNIWIVCDTYWFDRTEWFKYVVTKWWIANLSSITSNQRTGRQKLEITWRQIGETDIYIYKLWEHRATIKVKVIPKLPLKVTWGIVKIKEWESTTIQVSGGWWMYKVQDYNKEVVYASINKYTGVLKIRWLKTGETYLRILDKYNQSITATIIIKEVKLSIWSYKKEIKTWEQIQIEIYDYYKSITAFQKNNTNISAVIKDYDTTQKSIIITGKKSWESVVYIKDWKWSEEYIRVKVFGGDVWDEKEEESEEEKEEEKEEGNNEKIEDEFENELKKLLEEFWIKIEWVNINNYQDWLDKNTGTTVPMDNNFSDFLQKEENKKELRKEIEKEYLNKWYKVSEAEFNYWVANNAVPYWEINSRKKEKIKEFQLKNTKIRILIEKYLKWKNPEKYFKTRDKIKKLITWSEWKRLTKKWYYYLALYKAFNETLRQHWIKYAKDNWLEMDPYLKKELWTVWSILSWLPAVWEWYDILSLIDWKDPLTGDKLENYEKIFVFIWLASWVWSWKATKDLVNTWLEKISKELWVSLSEVVKIAKEVAGEYKIDSLANLIKLKDDLNIDKFLGKVRGKIKVAKFLKNKWTAKLEKHIFEGDFKTDIWGKISLSGVHYKTWIKKKISWKNTDWDIRIKNKKELENWFYEWNIEWYSDKLYKSHWPDPRVQLDMKWWVKKKDASTFFPDNWSKEKIKTEIWEAYGNIKEVSVIKNWKTEILYRWKTSDWTSIQFYKDLNWNIESAFPNFQSNFNNLFN